MSVAVWVVRVGDYNPKMCEITLPNLKAYANRMGAEFNMITERRFPDLHPICEKLQLWELGKGYKHNILIDADMLIHPNLPSAVEVVPLDSVGTQLEYPADAFFKADKYFVRDGRKLALVTNFIVTTMLTHDLWRPLDITISEALQNVHSDHCLDEYWVSRNLSRFGLKHVGLVKDQSLVCHLDATIDGDKSDESLAKMAEETLAGWQRHI